MLALATDRLITTVESATAPDGTGLQRFVPTHYLRCGDQLAFQLPVRPGLRYRWRWNELTLPGGADGRLVLPNLGTVAAGNYSVQAEDAHGSREWTVAIVAVVAEAHLTQFALHGNAGDSDPALLGGFFIGGAGTKQVELRCGSVANCQLTLAGWDGQPIASAPARDFGSSLAATLESGSYSAVTTGSGSSSQPAVLELTDLDAPFASSSISNFSGRVTVAPGPAGVTLSFTLDGTTAATVLIRGIGPSLATLFSLPGALAQTRLVLRDENDQALASNVGWEGDAFLSAAFEQAGAFALAPSSRDSALVQTLAPGTYRAELMSGDDEGGIGLIEVYDIPAR